MSSSKSTSVSNPPPQDPDGFLVDGNGNVVTTAGSTSRTPHQQKTRYRRRRSGRHRSSWAATTDANAKAATAVAMRADADATERDANAKYASYTLMDEGPTASTLLADVNALRRHVASRRTAATALDAKVVALRVVAAKLATAEKNAFDAQVATTTTETAAAERKSGLEADLYQALKRAIDARDLAKCCFRRDPSPVHKIDWLQARTEVSKAKSSYKGTGFNYGPHLMQMAASSAVGPTTNDGRNDSGQRHS
jgi:hypothetical protein